MRRLLETVTGWHPLVLLTHVVRVWVFSWSPGAGAHTGTAALARQRGPGGQPGRNHYFSRVNWLTSMYPIRNILAQPVRYFI